MMASDYKPNSQGPNCSSTPPILLFTCLYWFHSTVLLYLHVSPGALHSKTNKKEKPGMYLAQKTSPQLPFAVLLPAASKVRDGEGSQAC